MLEKERLLRPSDEYIANLTQLGRREIPARNPVFPVQIYFLTFAVLLAATELLAECLVTKSLPYNGHVALNVVGCIAPFHTQCLKI